MWSPPRVGGQNRILMMQNAIPIRSRRRRAAASPSRPLAARGAATTPTRSGGCSTPASRSCGRCGTTSRPRVADIVAAAGLSNDAFYRHFASKDALVAAILEDGTARLRSYLDHQMAKARRPEGAGPPLGRGRAVAGATTRSPPRRSRCCGTAAASTPGRRPGARSPAPPLGTLLRRAVRRARQHATPSSTPRSSPTPSSAGWPTALAGHARRPPPRSTTSSTSASARSARPS